MPFDSQHPEHDPAPASKANADAVALPAKFELSELELGLPADLQHLAEQLSDDAQHLSALYPARASQQWQTAALQAATDSQEAASADGQLVKIRVWPIRWLKPVLVAASLLLAVTLAWQVVSKKPAPGFTPRLPVNAELKPTSRPASPDANELSTPDTTIAFHPVVDQPAESSHVIGNVQTEQTMVPAGLFITLSGPEQEAMLDLIEDAKLQQPSVSF